jgi:hypothetical protein
MITAFFQLILGIFTTVVKGIEYLLDHPKVGIPVAAVIAYFVIVQYVHYFALLLISLALLWAGYGAYKKGY